MATVRLADYRPPAWLIRHTAMTVRLFSEHAEVDTWLSFAPNPEVAPGPLLLRGHGLELLELRLDGEPLPAGAWAVGEVAPESPYAKAFS